MNKIKQIINKTFGLLKCCYNDGIMTTLRTTAKHIFSKIGWRYRKRHPLYQRIKIFIVKYNNPMNVTDADPFKILWVKPERITHEVTTSRGYRWGIVTHSDWETRLFEKKERYQSYKNFQQLAKTDQQSSTPDRNFITSDDTRSCQIKKELVQKIKKGYVTQKEIRPVYHNIPFYHRELEIRVNIDRNGELHWVGSGQNRLCAVKSLDVERVAIQINERHKEWQSIRDTVRSVDDINHLPDEVKQHLDHPDLQDIIHT